MRTADPINPQRVFWELSQAPAGQVHSDRRLGFVHRLVGPRPQDARRAWMRRCRATLATMGPGTPYAIAAKFAFPDRPVIAARRRRRHPDERHERDDHHQTLREAG